ncbi:hypothetical protein [Streptomyces sp. NRRL S-340]|uniref:hypothetical protein n=1 Tax=Streptomyces sp. NRRL S-340 TaxID=1463901 RepID=UPI00055CF10E|nr:hypothetical protein [Streptomyces sp. NRRL S-340]
MISTRRIVAVASLAVSVAGLAALPANAADSAVPVIGRAVPTGLLDSLGRTGIPAGRQDEVPPVSEQLSSLHHVQDLNQLSRLNAVTGLVSPLFGLVPAVQY